MPAKQWDQYTSFVNTYYAVQEHFDELQRTGHEAGTGLAAFCHDANPFLWDAQSSADPSVYGNFCSAFFTRFSSTQSTASDALTFCRNWLDQFGSQRYKGELLAAFDSVVDSPQTWESAYAPINDQLELRARINEWSPQDNPADHAPQEAPSETAPTQAAEKNEEDAEETASGRHLKEASEATDEAPAEKAPAESAPTPAPSEQGKPSEADSGNAAAEPTQPTAQSDGTETATTVSTPEPQTSLQDTNSTDTKMQQKTPAPAEQPTPTNILVHDWSGAKKSATPPAPAPAKPEEDQPTASTEEEDYDPELVALGAPRGVHKATLSDTDAIASLLALDDPLLARSLEEFIMHGMQCGTVVELVVREENEVVACAGLTYVELMPTAENPSGVCGVVSGLAAKPGYAQNLQLLLKTIEKKTLARGVGELMLLDSSAISVQACEQYGYRLEGSRILMRL